MGPQNPMAAIRELQNPMMDPMANMMNQQDPMADSDDESESDGP
jgi:hypothetical protein